MRHSNRQTFRAGQLVMRVVDDRIFIQLDNDPQPPTILSLSRDEIVAALGMLNTTNQDDGFVPLYDAITR